MSVSGKNVIVIGGSAGVGLGVAKLMQQSGANLTIVGRNEERLRKAQEEVGKCRIVAADIGDDASTARIFAGLDRVDHVFISAGTHHNARITGNELKTLHDIVNERLWGPVHVVRHARPLMSGGSITFTTGYLSTRPRVGSAMSTAVLAGVEALTPALALELAPIRVNCACLGTVDTTFLKHMYGDKHAEYVKTRGASLPVGRIGTTDEIAQFVLMLMTNEYVNGAVLNVDGGGRFV
jgi:NAD(P)-dependent dehydrogenase (short-subunit alcohol dehydrogenase family)